jgi:Bacterial proteasome activator
MDSRSDATATAPPSTGTNGEPVAGELVQEEQQRRGEAVESPAKVMRIGTMVKQLLDEVRAAPLDEASRGRLRSIFDESIKELDSVLSPDLADELSRLAPPFGDDQVPSDAQLRVAQAQLVGWLEGLFHGIQASLMAQQMAARQQLEQMRGQLPPAMPQQPGQPGQPERPGTYL